VRGSALLRAAAHRDSGRRRWRIAGGSLENLVLSRCRRPGLQEGCAARQSRPGGGERRTATSGLDWAVRRPAGCGGGLWAGDAWGCSHNSARCQSRGRRQVAGLPLRSHVRTSMPMGLRRGRSTSPRSDRAGPRSQHGAKPRAACGGGGGGTGQSTV